MSAESFALGNPYQINAGVELPADTGQPLPVVAEGLDPASVGPLDIGAAEAEQTVVAAEAPAIDLAPGLADAEASRGVPELSRNAAERTWWQHARPVLRGVARAALAFSLVTGAAAAANVAKAPVARADAIDTALADYPNINMPCEHPDSQGNYDITGSCYNYDWGPNHTTVLDDPSTLSSRGYAYRNCTDWVAWRVNSLGGNVPHNLGDGGSWYNNAPASERSLTPQAGDAAVKPGSPGHVAFIESVNSVDPSNPDNDNITVSEYNHDEVGTGDQRTGTASSMGFTEFVDFGVTPSGNGSSGETRSDQVIDVQKVDESGGTQQIYATTSSDVYQTWWNSGSNGPQTTDLINIAQNNIVDSSEIDAPGGEQELYTATSNGIWETNWGNGMGPQSSEIISGLSGVEKIIARTENDNGATTFQLYVMTNHGVYQYWWNNGSNGIQSVELQTTSNPIDISYSTNGGTDQLYTAYPGYVEETWWNSGGNINDDEVIGISQNNITAINKIVEPDGTNILAVATSGSEWDAEWGGSVGNMAYYYEVNNFSGALAVARQVDGGSNGNTQLLYLANGSTVQQYEWGANSGGGTALNISQNDIRAIVSDDYNGTDEVYTAAGNTVWETYYSGGTPHTDMIVNIDQQQG